MKQEKKEPVRTSRKPQIPVLYTSSGEWFVLCLLLQLFGLHGLIVLQVRKEPQEQGVISVPGGRNNCPTQVLSSE